MATFKKLPSGKWQAQISKQGVRQSKSFKTRNEAKAWAARAEYVIENREYEIPKMTVKELFARHADEVSPKRKGARWEIVRLNKLSRDSIADLTLAELKAAPFTDWRERRLKEVAPASVAREMNLMSSVFTVARQEWSLIEHNPLTDVKLPKAAAPRHRRVSGEEIEALKALAGTDIKNINGAYVSCILVRS